MRVTIFGASGRTGRLVMDEALARGYDVIAYVRDTARIAVAHDRLRVVEGALSDGARIADAIAGADAVISTLGPVANKPGTPIADGMQRIIDAMRIHGVDRLIATTGAGVPDPNDHPRLRHRAINRLLRLVSRHVIADSEAMMAAIRGSGLRWTVARAPRLVDQPAKGSVRVGFVGKGPGTILTRADFAAFVVDQLADETWIGTAPTLSSHTPTGVSRGPIRRLSPPS